MLQLDRLKDLTRRDTEEQAKKSKRVEDRKVITEQIEARQRAKLIRLEAREQVTGSFKREGNVELCFSSGLSCSIGHGAGES